jgi:hypothetical protein
MFVKYIENFLTPIECDSIIKIGESNDLIQMKSSRFVNGILVKENIKYDGNKRMGCYFENGYLQTPIIKTLSDRIIKLSNELSPFNGIQYNEVPKYSFNKYGTGDFLDWHPDSHEILNGATITFVIQLNDNYEGGNVKYSINDIEYSIEKKQGSIFVFDSTISHSVNTVTGGVRYSINVWPSKVIKKSLI